MNLRRIPSTSIVLLLIIMLTLAFCAPVPLLLTDRIHDVTNTTDDDDHSTKYVLQLMMNERTGYATAQCIVRAGRQFTIFFHQLLNITGSENINKIQLYSKDIRTNETVNWACTYINAQRTYRCNMWNLLIDNVLFDQHNRPVVYNLWAESESPPSTILWEYGGELKLVDHVFGCRPTTPLVIAIDAIEMSGVSISWKTHALARKLQPRFHVLLDNHVRANTTISDCDYECKQNIADVDTCKEHSICVRTMFDQTLFGTIPNNTDLSCVHLAPNCTTLHGHSVGNKIREPKNMITVIGLILVGLAVLTIAIIYLVRRDQKKHRLHRLQSAASDDGDNIHPRDTSYPLILPRSSHDYADILEAQEEEEEQQINEHEQHGRQTSFQPHIPGMPCDPDIPGIPEHAYQERQTFSTSTSVDDSDVGDMTPTTDLPSLWKPFDWFASRSRKTSASRHLISKKL